MAIMDGTLAVLLLMTTLGEGMPQDHFRAKSIPFGSSQSQQIRGFDTSQSTRDFSVDQLKLEPIRLEQSRINAPEIVPIVKTSIPKGPVLEPIERQSGEKNVLILVPTKKQEQQVHILRTKNDDDEAKLFRQQAENAKYAFETSVDDGIMGHTHSRSEVRDGLKVEGMYSYSDGFYRRTIHYVADDKGYRVVNEQVEPIGEGPLIDPKGEAIVKSSLGGEYRITVDDYQKKKTQSES